MTVDPHGFQHAPDASASGAVVSGCNQVDAAVAAVLADVPADGPVVVGVSGGCDSVVLLDALRRAGRWRPVVYHLDHGLRPESPADAAFVRTLAAGLDFHHECLDVAAHAVQQGLGVEEAGRRLRRCGMLRAAQASGASVVLTAHHRDDQTETVLFNILRGAGPAGIAGMPLELLLAPGIRLCRPLLHLPRSTLHTAAIERGLRWREDPSNLDQRYSRNRLRHDVLPTLEAGCPGIGGELAALAQRKAQELAALDARLDLLWPVVVAGARPATPVSSPPLQETAIHATPLLGEPEPVRLHAWRRWLRGLGLRHDRPLLRRLDALARGPNGCRMSLGPCLIRRRRGRLEASTAPPRQAAFRHATT